MTPPGSWRRHRGRGRSLPTMALAISPRALSRYKDNPSDPACPAPSHNPFFPSSYLISPYYYPASYIFIANESIPYKVLIVDENIRFLKADMKSSVKTYCIAILSNDCLMPNLIISISLQFIKIISSSPGLNLGYCYVFGGLCSICFFRAPSQC